MSPARGRAHRRCCVLSHGATDARSQRRGINRSVDAGRLSKACDCVVNSEACSGNRGRRGRLTCVVSPWRDALSPKRSAPRSPPVCRGIRTCGSVAPPAAIHRGLAFPNAHRPPSSCARRRHPLGRGPVRDAECAARRLQCRACRARGARAAVAVRARCRRQGARRRAGPDLLVLVLDRRAGGRRALPPPGDRLTAAGAGRGDRPGTRVRRDPARHRKLSGSRVLPPPRLRRIRPHRRLSPGTHAISGS